MTMVLDHSYIIEAATRESRVIWTGRYQFFETTPDTYHALSRYPK
jgi:hypothetical protein